MKRSSKELKQLAREALPGSYGIFIACFLVYTLVSIVLQSVPAFLTSSSLQTVTGTIVMDLISLILSLLLTVVAAGFQKIALNICREEAVTISDLFFSFKHHPDKIIIVTVLMLVVMFIFEIPAIALITTAFFLSDGGTPLTGLFIFGIIAAIILMFVGIIVLFRYSLAITLLVDHPELSAMESMKTSSSLMKGNILRYLYLNLSFLGMGLLCILSLGIASLWVYPYMTVTLTEFYLEITGELDGGPRETAYPQAEYY